MKTILKVEKRILPAAGPTLAEKFKRHVYKLSHEIGDRSHEKYDKLDEAARYITKEFESFGYEVEFQAYSAREKVFRNIIVTKPGTPGSEKADEILVLGAHYDTYGNPGADDNASGVAGLLEMARIFHGRETGRTIKFVAFVNEEPPFFKKKHMGSRVYTKAAKKNGENIKGAFILETIGYYSNERNSQHYPPGFGFFFPNKGNFIGVVGNFKSVKFVKNIVSSFKKGTKFPVEWIVAPSLVIGVDYSDNWSFWQEGYPAVMITNTAFYRNPHYHKATDTYDTLNYESAAEVVKGVSATLTTFAS